MILTNINIQISGANAHAVVDGKLTTGMVGVPCEISYDNSWDGLEKRVIFRVNGVSRYVETNESNVTVPWEVMRNSGLLQIGAEGRNAEGTIVIPTIWAKVAMVEHGAFSQIRSAPISKTPGEENSGFNYPLTFTGAVTAVYDGSEAVNVDIPSGGSGGSGISALIVTMSEDGTTASHTPAQIYAHLQAGGTALLYHDSEYWALSRCSEFDSSFVYFSVEEQTLRECSLFDTGVEFFSHKYTIDDDIPKTLPNPNTLTITGAVSATYDGSKAVSIEIPSGGGSGGSGGASGWTYIDTIDLSSGALVYEIDTTGCTEVAIANITALVMGGCTMRWKDSYRSVAGVNHSLQKNIGTVYTFHYLGNGYIAFSNGRSGDTLLNTHVGNDAIETNNTLKISFTSVTSGTIVIAGRV